MFLDNDSSIHRGGKQGLYREKLIKFNTSLLKVGENTIRLEIKGKEWKSIMYDYLKLEIDNS